MFPPEPYLNVDNKAVREKLLDSDAYATNPAAKLSDSFVTKLWKKFNQSVFESRTNILIDLLQKEYTTENIGTQAVIDTAKTCRIHYFLNYEKDKLVKNIIRQFKKTA